MQKKSEMSTLSWEGVSLLSRWLLLLLQPGLKGKRPRAEVAGGSCWKGHVTEGTINLGQILLNYPIAAAEPNCGFQNVFSQINFQSDEHITVVLTVFVTFNMQFSTGNRPGSAYIQS